MGPTSIVYIVDDHVMFAEGLAGILRSNSWIQEVKLFHDENKLKEACERQLPDVLLLDYFLPNTNGLKLAVDLLALYPKLKIIMVTMDDNMSIVEKCELIGIKGYFRKDLSTDQLLKGMIDVLKGLTYFELAVSVKRSSRYDQQEVLSPREKQIVSYLLQGLTSGEIAEKCNLSSFTVDTHRKNILKKLELKNTSMLLAWASDSKNSFLKKQ